MLNGLKPLSRSLRWGMVGGGGTSQIGYSHRCAALRDNVYTLLAGALDVDAERGRAFGEQLGIAPERCYADYQTLFREEAQRPDGIEVVSVTTPNNTHFAITKAALEAGLHVICEKPLCFTAEEARELVDLSKKQNKIVGVTYGYAGYQMIQQARQMIADGLLGEIRIVNMQFAHGFHNQAVELRGRIHPLASNTEVCRAQLCAWGSGHPSAVCRRNHGAAAQYQTADVLPSELCSLPRAAGR